MLTGRRTIRLGKSTYLMSPVLSTPFSWKAKSPCIDCLEVSLKKSMNFFRRSQPEAANMVSVAREMHALDLMSYYHDNKIACVNVSQSIHCMPMVATHEEYLSCLTCGAKIMKVQWSLALVLFLTPACMFPHKPF